MSKNGLDTIREKVIGNALGKGLIKPGDGVLTAFSGGADSLMLLLILNETKDKTGISLKAAHLNHGIRGAEADRDEEFCRSVCEELGIPFFCGKADVPRVSGETGEGLEECARRLRYDFLRETAKREGCVKIATAHHADDNIETVLFHLARGCGLKGLSGIPEERDGIIRPLLGINKKEILDFLRLEGRGYVTDSTNSDLEMSRNLIRHKVMPHLYAINPGADRAFTSMCRTVAEDEDYLSEEAGKIPDDADMKTLRPIHAALLSRFVKRRYESYFGGRTHPELGFLQTEAIVSFIKNGTGTKKYALPGDAVAYLGSFGLEIRPKNEAPAEDYVFPLSEGENDFSSYGYKIFITFDKNVAKELKNIYKLSIRASVDYDKISQYGLSVRNLRRGDAYGFGGYVRTVSRQLIKRKIPEFERKKLPAIISGNRMIWVPGLGVSDEYENEKERTGKPIYIIYCPETGSDRNF